MHILILVMLLALGPAATMGWFEGKPSFRGDDCGDWAINPLLYVCCMTRVLCTTDPPVQEARW